MPAVVRTETRIREWDAHGTLLSDRVVTEEDRTPFTRSEVAVEPRDLAARTPAGFVAGETR